MKIKKKQSIKVKSNDEEKINFHNPENDDDIVN